MTAAAAARAEAPAPSVWVKTGTLAARATISAPAPIVVVGPPAVLAFALVDPHPHIAAGHDDPVALVTDIGLVLLVLFVAGKLVAFRLVRLRR